MGQVYYPPERPGPTGDPVADVEVAYGWLQEFLNLRASIITIIANTLAGRVSRL